MLDFLRVAAAVPPLAVGDVKTNTAQILNMAKKAHEEGAQVVVFPELSLCGYTCGDLFFQQALLQGVKEGLAFLLSQTAELPAAILVGLPLAAGGALYSCAAVLCRGEVLGVVPKTFLPTYSEFYEHRWFSSAAGLQTDTLSPRELGIEAYQSRSVPFGTDLLFRFGDVSFGIELCEDLWAPIPPSSTLALRGAEVIFNLSASNETIAKRAYRRSLVSMQSAAQLGAYVYVSAGCTESTTDLIFSGHSIICESGKILRENAKTIDTDYVLCTDIDLGRLRADRLKNKTFSQSAALCRRDVRTVCAGALPAPDDFSYYPLEKMPFVPHSEADRQKRCADIFEMQVMALKKRMEHTGSRPVIGISGGLDSTLALLVSAEAARRAGRAMQDVVGITMPCFGTTDRTYQNALTLMKTLGITCVEIPISAAVEQHFADIGQPRDRLDLTFENAQARERTQVLMDYAGRIGGFVVGTGDLSELALGWCTYNADHMSMYGVNAGVPKTLVRWMIDSIRKYDVFAGCAAVLEDILDTPISPELLPPDAGGKIAQKTEQIVGPYVLHDFFLYYVVRYGFSPEKIFALACAAFAGEFEKETIKKWLVSFYRRFFSQQFKRSCLPDGVKIGSICLSPRGDWRMPSDACAALWIAQAEALL